MKKIFLDANVLFSGSNEKSNLYLFLCFLSEHHALITSDYAYEEARRNVLLKRPQWKPGFDKLSGVVPRTSTTQLQHNEITLDEKDRPILGSAIAQECDYLLTGDKKDFGHLYGTTIDTVTVISYLELAKVITKK